ncbi:HNH endonuclease family protein [Corynebacterium glyciniphilum]|uniref:HNH endonuclease family protein n=1 Tax=Corynebacterium glyciniphilum TaxID=1404244 RepID=UPI003DA10B8B
MVPFTVILLLALSVWHATGPHSVDGRAAPRPVDRTTVKQALEGLTTVPRRTHVLGYSRDEFGGWAQQWWTEPDVGPEEQSGAQCTTRTVVMLQVFPDRSRADSGSCPSALGNITDVYTGDQIVPSDVEVDHVVPLSAGWDHGAWAWPRAVRIAFANDLELNLLAVAGTVNQAKSDGSLGEWLPPTAKAGSPSEAGCAYAARYLAVCLRYQLTVSDADVKTARRACGV